MSHEELIVSLKQEAEEKIRTINQASLAEREKIRMETAEEIERKRDAYGRKQLHVEQEQERSIIARAEREGAQLRLEAEAALSDRLRSLTLASLALLREDRYESLFLSLVREIPSFTWETVKVNELDVSLARKHFPAAEIIFDNKITGGLEVLAENGVIQIINTLNKRAENAFAELLPLMIKKIYKRYIT